MSATMVWLLSVAVAACEGGLQVDCEPTGWLDVKVDGQTVLTGGLSCHGHQWRHAGQEEAPTAAKLAPGRFRGAFPMPKGNKGHLAFEQKVRPERDAFVVDYTTTFEQDNEIKLQAVSLHLPAAAFAGRRLTFYPAEARVELPKKDQAVRSEHFGWAVAAELDPQRVLLIRTRQPTMLSFMDYRQWEGKGFGVNVRMVGEGKVPAGATTRRRLTLSIVSPEEAQRLAARWRPEFDRTQPSLLLDANGRLWLRDQQRDYASAGIAVQGLHWAYSAQDDTVGWCETASDQRTIRGMIPVKGEGGTSMRFKQVARSVPDGLDLSYHIEFPRDCRLNAYQVTWALRTEIFAGEQIVLIGPRTTTTSAVAPTTQSPTSQQTLMIAREPPAKSEIGTFRVNRVAVAPGHPLGFTLGFDRPIELRVEDRRAEDSQTYHLRMQFARNKDGMLVKAGTVSEARVQLRPNRPHAVVLHDAGWAHRTDTKDWIPFTLPWATSAIDLSFLNDRSAGGHGFLQIRDGRFVFKDGTPARFWGTCFSAEQNLPPHRDAEITARRLARYGVNMVRIHQADAGYASDNLFRTKRQGNGTRQLNPAMMDRLDYLIAQLKKNGIYVYFDLLSTRTFDASDGVTSAEKLELGGKPYTNFDEHLIRLQEAFARQFLTHANPYTKLTYKDDPAVAMIALVNENDVFCKPIKVEPYRSQFEKRYRAWAAKRKVKLPEGKMDLTHKTPPLMRFFTEIQRAYNERMMRLCRSLGVRVPITGSNWTINAGLVAALEPVDFTDSHGYWDHCWDNYTRIRNRVMIRSRQTIFGRLAFQRVPDKPFFCSEWGQPWPNEFRAEMPLSVASVAALQGWGGALIYTYAHYSYPAVDSLSGPFDTLNDPCLFGLFYHAALMVRRPDVEPARRRLAVQIPDKKIYAEKPATPARCSVYDVAAERSVLATAAGRDAPSGWQAVPLSRSILPITAHTVASDTGQYHRDWRAGVATINTPRTQAAWGFLGALDRPVRLGDVELKVHTPFAAVAISSLTDDPIGRSGRLLLTAVSRAENTGMVYDLFHTRKIAAGHGPILIEPVRGHVSIRTSRRDLTVRGLGPLGQCVAEVPAEVAGGCLRFEMGPRAKTMYYLIE